MSPTTDFITFCETNKIVHSSLHEKPVTKGCSAAITARSEALKTPLSLRQELKTILLNAKDGTLIAIHMPGDRRLVTRVQMSDYCKQFREVNVDGNICNFSALSVMLGIEIQGMAKAVSGTLNPISLHLEYGDKIKQFFDSSLNPDGAYYTNTGEQTHGIGIAKLQQLMDVIPHKMVHVTEPVISSSLGR
jgi:hypothetical protein